MSTPVPGTATTGQGNASGYTVAAPGGIAVGDYLFGIITGNHFVSTSFTGGGGGWTSLGSFDNGTNSVYLWGKTVVAGDIGATFTVVGSSTGSMASTAGITPITGVDTLNPIPAASSTYADSGGGLATSFSVAGITPPVGNCLYLMGIGTTNSTGLPSVSNEAIAANNPTWAEAFDISRANGTPRCGSCIASGPQIVGGGIATGNISASISVNSLWAMGFITLQPPVVANNGKFLTFM